MFKKNKKQKGFPNQPPMGQQRPPMGQPQMGQQRPPMGQPPMGQPPMGQPPMGQQRPPMGQQRPPMGQQRPPMGQQRPPMGQQRPPMGQQRPLNKQQKNSGSLLSKLNPFKKKEQINENMGNPNNSQMPHSPFNQNRNNRQQPFVDNNNPRNNQNQGPMNNQPPRRIPDMNDNNYNPQNPQVNMGFSSENKQGREANYDVEREYYSSDRAKDVYGQKTMEQNIFLYAPPASHLSIQKYINENYAGVVVMGTSKLSAVIEEYKRKLNTSAVLIFISTEEELKALVPFIELLLEIKSKNPEMLTICSILAKNVKPNIIQGIKRANLINLMQLNGDITTLSMSNIDNVMASIVANQPTFLGDSIKKIDQPKKARKRKSVDVNQLFRTKDLEELKREVAIDRSNFDAEKLYDTLSNTLANAKGEEDIEKMVSMIPELSRLEEYRKDLEEYINESEGRLSPEQLNEVMISKLEATSVQEQSLREIFNMLIEYTSKRAEREQESTKQTNIGIVRNSEIPENSDISKLMEQRENIKQRAEESFSKYKREVQILSNAIETRKYLYQNLQKSLLPVLTNESSKEIDSEVEDTTRMFLEKLNTSRMELDNMRVESQKALKNTLSYVNSILKEYKVVIQLDDIIIDRLIEDRDKAYTNSINKVYTVDNELKARGKYIKLLDIKPFNMLTKVIYKNTFLIITNIEELEFNSTMTHKTASEFIESDYSDNKVNVVTILDWDDKDKLEERMTLLLNKVKFIGKYFQKVIFIFDNNIDSYIENKVVSELPEFCVLTDISKDNLIETNKQLKYSENFQDIYGRTIIYNNYDAENSELTINEIRVLSGAKKGIKEIYVNTDKSLRDKKELAKLIIQFRNI